MRESHHNRMRSPLPDQYRSPRAACFRSVKERYAPRSQLRAALRWRSQFSLEPSSGFFGFHRIDQRDDALINVIASTAFECSDVKARPAGRRGEPSIVFDPVVEFSALVTHRGSTFRVTMRGDKMRGDKMRGDKMRGDKMRGDKMRGDKRPADLFIYRIRTPLNPTWTLGRSRGRGRPFSSTSRGAGLAHALAPIDRCSIRGEKPDASAGSPDSAKGYWLISILERRISVP
jgi:hypothetical protein